MCITYNNEGNKHENKTNQNKKHSVHIMHNHNHSLYCIKKLLFQIKYF